MSFIKLPLLYIGSKGEKNLDTVFNTGASLSCIKKSLLTGLEEPVMLGRKRQLATVNEAWFVEVNEVTRLDFYINEILLSDEFLVVPTLGPEVIIGAATLNKWGIKLDFGLGKIDIDPKVEKLQLI